MFHHLRVVIQCKDHGYLFKVIVFTVVFLRKDKTGNECNVMLVCHVISDMRYYFQVETLPSRYCFSFDQYLCFLVSC